MHDCKYTGDITNEIKELVNRLVVDFYPQLRSVFIPQDEITRGYKLRMIQTVCEMIDHMSPEDRVKQQDNFVEDLIDDAINETNEDVDHILDPGNVVHLSELGSEFISNVSIHSLTNADLLSGDGSQVLIDMKDNTKYILFCNNSEIRTQILHIFDLIHNGCTITQKRFLSDVYAMYLHIINQVSASV